MNQEYTVVAVINDRTYPLMMGSFIVGVGHSTHVDACNAAIDRAVELLKQYKTVKIGLSDATIPRINKMLAALKSPIWETGE